MDRTTIDQMEKDALTQCQNDSDSIGMYSFYDTKSDRYDTPFFCQNDLFAGRHYKMIVDKEGTMINKFKRDFDVHRIGFFHINTGTIDMHTDVIIEGKKLYKEDTES